MNPESLEEYAAKLDRQHAAAVKLRELDAALAKALHEARLRDEFAMAALTGLVPHTGGEPLEDVATCCYQLADAMLAAREKPEAPK